ncbi:hypothetical protein MLD38_023671 [Melastoma candidum]|nr:hypothetical protein MLD38_023671 [Melastoma candidum]
MMTGSRAIDRNRPKGKHDIVEWSKPYLSSKRKIVTVMDPKLEGKYPIAAAMLMAMLAMECIESSPKKRPPMSEVVRRMEEIAVTS